LHKILLLLLMLPLALVFLFFHNSLTSASINQEINFQGKIVNKTNGTNLSNGSPACVKSGTDTCDFKASIYSADSGGTALWS
jgi:hypothetical protein